MTTTRNGHGRNGCAKPAGGRIAPAHLDWIEVGETAPLEPSATAVSPAPKPPAEGRDACGKFAAGNRCGKGNPHARRMAALRQAFLSAATEENMKELGEKLLAAALAGDVQAAKLYLLHVIGRPADAVNPDTLDMDEWRGREEWEAISTEWFRKMSLADAIRIAQALSELRHDSIERAPPAAAAGK